MKAARKTSRHRHRDSTLILVTYRHGFRVTELTALRWDQVELDSGRMHVGRIKKGTPSVHPVRGPEIRALRRLKRDYPETPYVFVTERKGPLSNSAVAKMIARAGEVAEFEFPVHPHMLRHATGYMLANDGHACASHPAIPRPQEHPAHCPLYRACFNPISRLLEGLGDIGKPQMALHCGFASSGPCCRSYAAMAL